MDDENPILRRIDPHNGLQVEATWNVIRSAITETQGAKPRTLAAMLMRLNTDKFSRYGKAHRLVARWELPGISATAVDELERMVERMHHPNPVRTRRVDFGGKVQPRQYVTPQCGRLKRTREYIFMPEGYVGTGSTGLIVGRDFGTPRRAASSVRGKNWLNGGKAYVEIRESSEQLCLDFVEAVVQTAHILRHERQASPDKLLCRLYADLARVGKSRITLDHIAGLENIKEEMYWTVFAPAINPDAARFFGLQPEGVMLAGIPGTGKSLITEYLLWQDLNCIFVTTSAVKLLVDKFNSESDDEDFEDESSLFSALSRLRKRCNSPVALFCDEIEAALTVAEGSSAFDLATTSTLLNRLSGLTEADNPRLCGSTNYPWYVDERFFRFGRIGYCLHVGLPDAQAREQALHVFTKNIFCKTDLHELARSTRGYTPVQLREIVQKAGRYALQRICNEKKILAGLGTAHALSELSADDLQGQQISDSDFQAAYKTVAQRVNPGNNQEWDRQIAAFCRDFKQSGYESTRSGFFGTKD